MRSTFIGTGAFVGAIEGDSRCSFWADEPTDHGFDKKRLISVDLARTPSAAAAREISWSAVEVDDCILSSAGKPSGTTIGPRWPELQLIGAVYLEQNTWLNIPEELRPACPPLGAEGHPYEYMSAVYWPNTSDPRAGARYAGYHAEILEEQGTLAFVAVYPAGMSRRADAQPMTMWIDLSSHEQCDAGVNSLTQIGVGSAPKSGALFLPNGRLEGVAAGNTPRAHEDAVTSEPALTAATGETMLRFDHSGGPKVPPWSAAPAAPSTSAGWPKLPPMSGQPGESPSPGVPKLPPLQAESAERKPSVGGPKLPPMFAESSAPSPSIGIPKLPPMTGQADAPRAPSTGIPKLPPTFGQPGAPSASIGIPKLPPFQAQPVASATSAGGPKIPPWTASPAAPVTSIGGPKIPPWMSAATAPTTAGAGGPKLPPWLGAATAPTTAGSGAPKLPPFFGATSVRAPSIGGPKIPIWLADSSLMPRAAGWPKIPPMQGR